VPLQPWAFAVGVRPASAVNATTKQSRKNLEHDFVMEAPLVLNCLSAYPDSYGVTHGSARPPEDAQPPGNISRCELYGPKNHGFNSAVQLYRQIHNFVNTKYRRKSREFTRSSSETTRLFLSTVFIFNNIKAIFLKIFAFYLKIFAF
jgi:hypothetical protein